MGRRRRMAAPRLIQALIEFREFLFSMGIETDPRQGETIRHHQDRLVSTFPDEYTAWRTKLKLRGEI